MMYHFGEVGTIFNVIFVVLFSRINLFIQLFSFNINSILSIIYFVIFGVFYLNMNKVNQFLKLLFCMIIAFLDFYILVSSNWT